METRYSEQTGIMMHALKVYNVTLRRHETGWSHFDTNNNRPDLGSRVGPWYKTKAEIMADHESYLVRAGWLTQ